MKRIFAALLILSLLLPALGEGDLKPGDSVLFGRYEQDGISENGPEPIEWVVISVSQDDALLLSRYALTVLPYNDVYKPVTWESSLLRACLNGEFYETAFDEDEKERVLLCEVSADRNRQYATDPGNPTRDAVFLLSYAEVLKYLSRNDLKFCRPTRYACLTAGRAENGECCIWWLRSPGMNPSCAAAISANGMLQNGKVDYPAYFVRPAIRIPACWDE